MPKFYSRAEFNETALARKALVGANIVRNWPYDPFIANVGRSFTYSRETNLWYATGSSAGDGLVYYSREGRTWENLSPGGLVGFVPSQGYAFASSSPSNSVLFMVGDFGVASSKGRFSLDNGATWSTSTIGSADSAVATACYWHESGYWLAGDDSARIFKTVGSSPSSFSLEADGTAGSINQFYADDSGDNVIATTSVMTTYYTSIDAGVTWVTRTFPNTHSLSHITYSPYWGKWFGTATDRIYSSTDMINWTEVLDTGHSLSHIQDVDGILVMYQGGSVDSVSASFDGGVTLEEQTFLTACNVSAVARRRIGDPVHQLIYSPGAGTAMLASMRG